MFKRQKVHVEVKNPKRKGDSPSKKVKKRSKSEDQGKLGGLIKRGKTLFKGTFGNENDEIDDDGTQDK